MGGVREASASTYPRRGQFHRVGTLAVVQRTLDYIETSSLLFSAFRFAFENGVCMVFARCGMYRTFRKLRSVIGGLLPMKGKLAEFRPSKNR